MRRIDQLRAMYPGVDEDRLSYIAWMMGLKQYYVEERLENIQEVLGDGYVMLSSKNHDLVGPPYLQWLHGDDHTDVITIKTFDRDPRVEITIPMYELVDLLKGDDNVFPEFDDDWANDACAEDYRNAKTQALEEDLDEDAAEEAALTAEGNCVGERFKEYENAVEWACRRALQAIHVDVETTHGPQQPTTLVFTPDRCWGEILVGLTGWFDVDEALKEHGSGAAAIRARLGSLLAYGADDSGRTLLALYRLALR